MSIKDDSLTFFSRIPRPTFFNDKVGHEGASQEKKSNNRQKFVTYQVTHENLHRAIRDLQMPLDLLRHFDENLKSNRRYLAPLKYFGFKTDAEIRKNLFTTQPESESPEVENFKGVLASMRMVITRKREKGKSLATIPDLLAEHLHEMNCETYFNLSRNISNILWLFSDAARKYNDSKSRKLSKCEPEPVIYDFTKLSQVFENIFYEGFLKLGEPDFTKLSGASFLNFLKWRSICHCGPFLDQTGTFREKTGDQESVAIYVMGQFESLKIFNFGKPLHGLYLFEPSSFRNSKKFEPLPQWFLNAPTIIHNHITELISTFERFI